MTFILPAMMNVVQEIPCLFPKVDQLIVIIVDEQGKAFLIGLLPQESIMAQDVGSMKIIYSTE